MQTFIENFIIAKYKQGISKKSLYKDCKQLTLKYSQLYAKIVNKQIDIYKQQITY